MTDSISTLLARIDDRARKLNLSDRSLSMAATGKPDAIRYIRMRRAMPGADRLKAIADVLDTSVDYLIGSTDEPTPEPATRADLAAMTPSQLLRGVDAAGEIQGWPNDIPVYGTDLGKAVNYKSASGAYVSVEALGVLLTTPVSYFRRHENLRNKRGLYGLFIIGTSMEPVYEVGSVALIDPTRPPSLRDYVVVRLRADGVHNDDGFSPILFKRLIQRHPDWYEFEQFSPAQTFRVPATAVEALHRAFSVNDILGV